MGGRQPPDGRCGHPEMIYILGETSATGRASLKDAGMPKAQKNDSAAKSGSQETNVVPHPASRSADTHRTRGQKPLRVLLIEDNADDVELLRRALADGAAPASLVSVGTLREAIQIAQQQEFDVALLDLGLPDSGGLDTLRAFLRRTRLPCVVFTGLGHEAIGLAAINEGAQDVLVKGEDNLTGPAMRRALRYAVERHRLLGRIESLTLYDEASGLLNRRGFLNTGRDLLNTADRLGQHVLLLFMDFDNFKSINDQHGHAQGDQAIADAAKILLKTFRKADMVGRVGGDEFAVLALVRDPELGKVLTQRLDEEIAAYNASKLRPWTLSISVGSAWSSPQKPLSFEELLERADSVMYAKKRARGGAR